LENSSLPLGMRCEESAHGTVELVRAEYFVGVPCLQNLENYFFDVIQVLLRFERVVDSVVPCFVEFFVAQSRVVAKMRAARGFDQAVRHQRSRRYDRFYDTPINKVGNDQTLLGDRHRTS